LIGIGPDSKVVDLRGGIEVGDISEACVSGDSGALESEKRGYSALAENRTNSETFDFIFGRCLLIVLRLQVLIDFLPELLHARSTLGDAAHEGRTNLHISKLTSLIRHY
jgi:hypothetical protein